MPLRHEHPSENQTDQYPGAADEVAQHVQRRPREACGLTSAPLFVGEQQERVRGGEEMGQDADGWIGAVRTQAGQQEDDESGREGNDG